MSEETKWNIYGCDDSGHYQRCAGSEAELKLIVRSLTSGETGTIDKITKVVVTREDVDIADFDIRYALAEALRRSIYDGKVDFVGVVGRLDYSFDVIQTNSTGYHGYGLLNGVNVRWRYDGGQFIVGYVG